MKKLFSSLPIAVCKSFFSYILLQNSQPQPCREHRTLSEILWIFMPLFTRDLTSGSASSSSPPFLSSLRVTDSLLSVPWFPHPCYCFFFCPVLANLFPPPLTTSISGSYSILSQHHFWNFISRTSLLNPHLQFFQPPCSCSNSPIIPRPPIRWPTFLSINNSIPALLLALPSLDSALQYYDHSLALSLCLFTLQTSTLV